MTTGWINCELPPGLKALSDRFEPGPRRLFKTRLIMGHLSKVWGKEKMPFCGSCGEVFLEKQKFCVSCGESAKFNKNPKPQESHNLSELSHEDLDVLFDKVAEEIVNRDEVEQFDRKGQTNEKWTVGAWFRLTALLGLGYPALTGAVAMPNYAEYVTFDFTADTLINGGWLIYYWGLEAQAARYLDMPGLDAGITRLILWAIVGAAVSLSFPDFAKAIRRFIRSTR